METFIAGQREQLQELADQLTDFARRLSVSARAPACPS